MDKIESASESFVLNRLVDLEPQLEDLDDMLDEMRVNAETNMDNSMASLPLNLTLPAELRPIWFLDTVVKVIFYGKSSRRTSEHVSFTDGTDKYTIALGVNRTNVTKDRFIYLELINGPRI